jgi:F-type H+-transporting ATPase subunit alpha
MAFIKASPKKSEKVEIMGTSKTFQGDEERALLRSRKKPDAPNLKILEDFVLEHYGRPIPIEWEEDPEIENGFILRVGSEVYDWSLAGRVKQFMDAVDHVSRRQDNYISMLAEEMKDWKPRVRSREVGKVTRLGDGITKLSGLRHCTYNEIVVFDNGIKGLILDIDENEAGCIILGDANSIEAGDLVYRTGRTAAVPVSSKLLGRVLDALGRPIDGGPPIEAHHYFPIENQAPEILDREPVMRPLETGILAIDSMIPIGRGQRELIIGDRQTGKTQIALDTIVNQKGKDVICIYVGIGQKNASMAHLVNELKQRGAMDYTIILSAPAADTIAKQYLAPYSGTAMAEYFMHQGKDVLIIYDDLSKHAVAYRSISLLLDRFPGREAYPGDVFYLHSRLLERSAQLSDKKGGGSLTALPIVETQNGDISAYIPTNIISITDGQIFLETELFFSGQRPAINLGLSVSRVGGAAQTKAMKQVAKSLRLNLAQYREMKIFTQFSSDLDSLTKKQLMAGERLTEMLKQRAYQPQSLMEQVIRLVIGSDPLIYRVETDKVHRFLEELVPFVKNRLPDLVQRVNREGTLAVEDEKRIVDVANDFLKGWS